MILELPARACLFVGEVSPEVAAAAPWLVELVPDAALFSNWQSKGWRQNWGILLRSELSITEMAITMRRRAQAVLPDGDLVLFRYYDPRVWRNYIIECDLAELCDWFDGVIDYIAPDLDGRQSLQYSLQGDRLVIDAF